MKTNETLATTTGLLGHLADTMLKLEQRKISVDDAKAQASLVKQSNNLLRFELDLEKYKGKVLENSKQQK
jgi:hypothetical protein